MSATQYRKYEPDSGVASMERIRIVSEDRAMCPPENLHPQRYEDAHDVCSSNSSVP